MGSLSVMTSHQLQGATNPTLHLCGPSSTARVGRLLMMRAAYHDYFRSGFQQRFLGLVGYDIGLIVKYDPLAEWAIQGSRVRISQGPCFCWKRQFFTPFQASVYLDLKFRAGDTTSSWFLGLVGYDIGLIVTYDSL